MHATNASTIDSVVTTRLADRAAGRSQIRVVLFSGGSGTHSLTEAFLRHPQISLRILINAYDDGHSTGRLRRFLRGMLGPSDVRKNIARLMPTADRSQRSLKGLSDYRLPVGIPRNDALATLDRILDGDFGRLPDKLGREFPHLASWQLRQLLAFLASFRDYHDKQERSDQRFDFTDCALGNLFFAGCYLAQACDFNRAIDAYSEFYEVPPGVLLNITRGENLFLVAEKENGAFLLNEADIVAAQDATRITELFLVDDETYARQIEDAVEPPDGWGPLFRQAHRVPDLNPVAAAALAEADVIVYGPGTQHSSLFPSYMTAGVAEAITANTTADKVFIGNIHRDFDIQAEDGSDLARKLLVAMSRKGRVTLRWHDVVSHFFMQGTDENTLSRAKYVPFDQTRFEFPLETVRVRDWEAQEGRHSGGYVVDELRRILQARIDSELAQVHHMVSIIIPVLNEEHTVEQVLHSVAALDFQHLGLAKELIVVDGGSTDRTVELARSVRAVKVVSLPKRLGRGAAMRMGLERARGNIVVFFPGDDEYRPEDLYSLVSLLVNSRFRVVFGTRAVKCTDLSERLKRIYHNNRRLYLVSKYGGMLLSVTALLLFNRYVSDVLSTVKGYDAHLLRSLALESNSLDLETEIVAKLARRREYILEMPVDYRPRSRSEGKKIRSADGLRALLALAWYRLKSA